MCSCSHSPERRERVRTAPRSHEEAPMTRSVRVHEFGGPEVLRIEDVETEQPGGGEGRLRIGAIGINRTEITMRSGRSPARPSLPTKIGWEAAGENDALCANRRGFAVGGSRGVCSAHH